MGLKKRKPYPCQNRSKGAVCVCRWSNKWLFNLSKQDYIKLLDKYAQVLLQIIFQIFVCWKFSMYM